MKVSVVANISIRLPVKNVGTGEEEVVSVPLKVDELVQLDIPDQPTNRFYPFTLQTKRLYISQQIRKRLQDTIIDSITQNLNNDISSLVEAVEDSPPRIITIRDFEDKDWRAYAKQNSTANFQIVSTGQAGNQPLFGQERVWRHTAPVWTNYQDTYFKNDKESGLTCAYEYLMEFSKNPQNSCKKAGRDKQTIDKYINWKGTKGEVFQQIFNKWFNRNKARFRIQDTSEYHPLPEVVSVGDLYCEWYDIKELDLSTEYSQVDEEKTLNVIDLLKWCIATSTRLNVIDCDGGHYLDYNPEEYVCFYPDLNLRKPKQFKGSILVKIANRHAYFEEEKDKKISYTKTKQKHNNRLEDSSYKKKNKTKGQKEHEEEVKATEFRYIGKYFDEEELKERARKYKQSCEPAIQAGVYTQQEIDKDVEDILDELNFIPPTPEQLVEFMDDKTYITHYYLGMSNLNGLISYIYKKLNRQPNKLTGRACSIDYATFGNLKLYSKAQPYENTSIDVRQLNKLIPKTKNEKGILPAISKIANLIHEQVSDEPDSIWSQFNPQMKRIFYESEIKPDVRKMKGDFKDEDELASYDLKRAYTNCLDNNKYGWCVYDVISQPKKYSGSFRPDWFYICKNKKDAEYPCIRGKGNLLYHGSLLQYCLEQVDIIYEIPPLRQLP
ncbi:MAG: hypothetical protein CMM62_20590, partial [Rhodospirillaceae bacterium]|nr:hypothetical protein [Rhodospirillaceae bacterium]